MNIEEVTAVDSAVRPKRKGKKHIDVGVSLKFFGKWII